MSFVVFSVPVARGAPWQGPTLGVRQLVPFVSLVSLVSIPGGNRDKERQRRRDRRRSRISVMRFGRTLPRRSLKDSYRVTWSARTGSSERRASVGRDAAGLEHPEHRRFSSPRSWRDARPGRPRFASRRAHADRHARYNSEVGQTARRSTS